MKIKQLIVLPIVAVMAYSCGNNGKYEAMDSSGADSVLLSADTTGAEKLIKTADMNMEVPSVNEATTQVSGLTAAYKGMVMNNHMQRHIRQSRTARISSDSVVRISSIVTTGDMTVRVPSQHLNEFMIKVGNLGGQVMARNFDIQDRTLDYLESNLKMNSRRELVEQQEAGRIKLKHPEDVLIFKDSFVDEQINKRRIDDAVTYSTMTISFTQPASVIKEHLADTDPDSYVLPFSTRLKLALSNGIEIAAAFALAFAHLWVFIVVGVAAWYIIRRVLKVRTLTKPGKPVAEL